MVLERVKEIFGINSNIKSNDKKNINSLTNINPRLEQPAKKFFKVERNTRDEIEEIQRLNTGLESSSIKRNKDAIKNKVMKKIKMIGHYLNTMESNIEKISQILSDTPGVSMEAQSNIDLAKRNIKSLKRKYNRIFSNKNLSTDTDKLVRRVKSINKIRKGLTNVRNSVEATAP